MSTIAAPVAERKDHEVIFGKVEGEDRGPNPMNPPRRHNDPYFWMRDDARKDPTVLAHLKEEKKYFEARTADLTELRDAIYKEHLSHMQETDMSAPYAHGPYLYYTREVEGKSYKLHCRVPLGKTPGKADDEEVIMDINQVAEGAAFCDVHAIAPAPPSHERIAYSVDWSGNEVYRIEFIQHGHDVQDVVEGTNGDITWGLDETNFFYVTKDATLRDNKVWRHIVGQPQSTDVCIYTDDDPLFSVAIDKSADGQTCIVGSVSSETSEFSLLDLRKGAESNELVMVRPREQGVRYTVDLLGTDTLVILTNEGGAINNKLVLAPRQHPADWSTVLVENRDDVFLEEHAVRSSFLVVGGRRDGLTRVWTMTLNSSGGFAGGGLQELEMPEPVFSVHVVFSHMHVYDATTFRIEYSSMATPTTWMEVDPASHGRHVVKQKEIGGGFDASLYQVERHFAEAPDRTRIPLSIVFRKDLDRSVPQPCLLYGYGSYGLSMDPSFAIKYLPYTERGMIYVVAHIRGGSEMGRAWYEVGAKYRTKRNTFSDFIAAAEYLVDNKMTTPSQLACEGRSAGGLLIGAVLNMRPDLFKAAIAGVPFVDVMTTMCDPSIPLTTGEWEEWGNPNEYRYYDYMLSYSPMDNVRAQDYPNIMVQAGLYDPRVAYWEPAKWVSKLRHCKTDTNEVLLNMDLESGHFSAKDRYKFYKESAIQQAFICRHLKAAVKLLLK